MKKNAQLNLKQAFWSSITMRLAYSHVDLIYLIIRTVLSRRIFGKASRLFEYIPLLRRNAR